MSHMKAFAENVSCAMGLDGEITPDVLAQAQALLDHKADLTDPDIRGLVRAIWAMKRGEAWSGSACGCCGKLHPRKFSGDCRDDNQRLPVDIVAMIGGATEDEVESVGLTKRQALELVWEYEVREELGTLRDR